MEKILDLKYGNDSPLQTLDLYLPSGGKGPFPLVVFIHGGAWQIGDKRDGQENSWMNLALNGYALASINYRLAPEVIHPEGLKDCKEALKFLRDNKDKYNLDMENVGVVGNSAGGHYALLVALTPNHPAFHSGAPDVPVKCSAVWYSPTDFLSGKETVLKSLINRIKYGLAIGSIERYFGKAYTSISDELLAEASPASYVSKDMPYILLQQGDADFIVPPDQADFFVEAAKKAGAEDKVILETFKGAGHMDKVFDTSANRIRMRQFLDKHLKDKWEGHPGRSGDKR